MANKSNEITTLKLKAKTKERLEKLKTHKRESYDEALQRILNILNICRQNPEQALVKLKRIDKARAVNLEIANSSSHKSKD